MYINHHLSTTTYQKWQKLASLSGIISDYSAAFFLNLLANPPGAVDALDGFPYHKRLITSTNRTGLASISNALGYIKLLAMVKQMLVEQ